MLLVTSNKPTLQRVEFSSQREAAALICIYIGCGYESEAAKALVRDEVHNYRELFAMGHENCQKAVRAAIDFLNGTYHTERG